MEKIGSFLLCFSMLLYAVQDVLSSASAGNLNEQRSSVYVFLVIVMAIMATTVLLRRHIKFNSVIRCVFLFSLYIFIDTFFIKGISSRSAIASCSISVWWLLTLLYFQMNQHNLTKVYSVFKRFAIFMFLFYIAMLFYASQNITLNYTTVEFARVGYVYHILSILPLLLLFRNKKLKNLCLVLAFVAVLFSFKRGAILILPVMLLTYLHVENTTGYAKNNIKKVLYLFFVFALVCFAINQYSNGYLTDRFSLEEISEGSGRIGLITTMLSNISMRDTYEVIFGIPNSMEVSMRLGAHNEWLNQLYDYGIIGIVLYALLMLNIVRVAQYLLKKKSVLAASFCAMTVYSLGIGLVSGWYFVHSTFYIMMFISMVKSFEKIDDHVLCQIL